MPPVFAVLSALAESIAPLFVAMGLFTRWASLMIAINMAVALYAEAHKGNPFELPALYLLGTLVIAVVGPGRFSLDARRGLRS